MCTWRKVKVIVLISQLWKNTLNLYTSPLSLHSLETNFKFSDSLVGPCIILGQKRGSLKRPLPVPIHPEGLILFWPESHCVTYHKEISGRFHPVPTSCLFFSLFGCYFQTRVFCENEHHPVQGKPLSKLFARKQHPADNHTLAWLEREPKVHSCTAPTVTSWPACGLSHSLSHSLGSEQEHLWPDCWVPTRPCPGSTHPRAEWKGLL